MDFHSHGTAISGLVASNAQYLAGLTQRTTLFGVKVPRHVAHPTVSEVYLGRHHVRR